MAQTQTPPDNNNALYFIVGGILVLAVVIAAFVFNSNRAENAYEPAAGYETTSPSETPDNTTDNMGAAPSGGATDTTDDGAPLAP